MISIRPTDQRGQTKTNWLDSRHSFSFGDYHDPQHHNFRALRVINEDWIAPGGGFGLHPHRDMEIVTIVLEGALEHKDSLGNGGIIQRGEIQRMTAGTGIMHSEFNASADETAHLLQVWMLPERKGLPPSYEQRTLDWTYVRNGLKLIASRDGREGAITVHQDVELFVGSLAAGGAATVRLGAARHAWLQMTRGALTLNGMPLRAGDGAAVSEEAKLSLAANEASEFLLFDLA